MQTAREIAQGLDQENLILIEAGQWTDYGTGECVVDTVDDYIIKLGVPNNELPFKGQLVVWLIKVCTPSQSIRVGLNPNETPSIGLSTPSKTKKLA